MNDLIIYESLKNIIPEYGIIKIITEFDNNILVLNYNRLVEELNEIYFITRANEKQTLMYFGVKKSTDEVKISSGMILANIYRFDYDIDSDFENDCDSEDTSSYNCYYRHEDDYYDGHYNTFYTDY